MKSTFAISLYLFLCIGACTDPKTYPPEVRDNFINGCCKQNESIRPICACMYEKVQAKYTFKEYVALEKKVKAGEAPKEFLEFIDQGMTACSQE